MNKFETQTVVYNVFREFCAGTRTQVTLIGRVHKIVVTASILHVGDDVYMQGPSEDEDIMAPLDFLFDLTDAIAEMKAEWTVTE